MQASDSMHKVLNRTRGTNLGDRIRVARSMVERTVGLLRTPELRPGEGLWIERSPSIHMFFMRFAIDCVFLGNRRADGSREVVGVRENLRPWSGIVWWVGGAHGAIEVAAGEAARAGLKPGDAVLFDSAGTEPA
jgi:uncharacterized membrane protein (UPF0127 family)